MRLGITLGIITVLAALLQGCGHKGPLTMPPPPASTPSTSK
ncbi:LPS translocon maturation chaperone LptM [Candidatus Ferrigenium straubiae]